MDVKGYRFEMACISDTGNVRIHNEDNVCFGGFCMPKEHQSLGQARLWEGETGSHPAAAVFDGMGGEALGELASYMAAAGFGQYLEGRDWTLDYSRQELSLQLKNLNDEVVEAAKKAGVSHMGTTASILALDRESFWVANLGDSPIFLIRNFGIRLLSRMHTNEALLEKMGIKSQRPGLVQFLGIPKEEFLVEPYVYGGRLQEGDLFLACSDGLTDMVPQREMMGALLQEGELGAMALRLRDLALQKGGRDNVTVILCRILGCDGKGV